MYLIHGVLMGLLWFRWVLTAGLLNHLHYSRALMLLSGPQLLMSALGPLPLKPASITMATGELYAGSVI